MTAAQITSVTASLVALIGAVTALVQLFQHGNRITALEKSSPNPVENSSKPPVS